MVNPDVIWDYCKCGNPIYEKASYCPSCNTLLNEGKIKEVFGRLSSHVDILTGKIYSKQTVEDSV